MTSNKSRAPDYFIVGLQKSGSYWLTALLDAHPEVQCLPAMHSGQSGPSEGRVFDMLAGIDTDGGAAFRNSFLNHHYGFYADLVPLLDKVSRDELYSKFRDRYMQWFGRWDKGKKFIGDKTVEYIYHLGMIDEWFPGVKKICIIRDPKDRVVSWHFDQLRKGRRERPEIDDDFVREYAEKVKREYECMLNYSGFIHCLTYERLSREPEQAALEIFEYLGASTAIDIVRHCIDESSMERLREKDQVYTTGRGKKQGEEVVSHYRKGVVGDWQNYLSSSHASFMDESILGLQKKVFEKYDIEKEAKA